MLYYIQVWLIKVSIDLFKKIFATESHSVFVTYIICKWNVDFVEAHIESSLIKQHYKTILLNDGEELL